MFLRGEIPWYLHQLSGHAETDDQCAAVEDQKKGFSSAAGTDECMFQKIGSELFARRMSDEFRSVDRYLHDPPSEDLRSDDPPYGLDFWQFRHI